MDKQNDSRTGPNPFRYTPFSKPMDKPPKKYTANETVPEDSMGAESVPVEFDNPGDLSKKFM